MKEENAKKMEDVESIGAEETVGTPQTPPQEGTAPSNITIPTQIDYTAGMEFTPLNGGQVLREVITDTYVTASKSEDEMVQKIDDALTILNSKRRGFAGYLSFGYLQLTLFYILKMYDECLKALDSIIHGVDCIEKYIFTDRYEDPQGNDSGFVNYAFGESDEELKNTVKYLHDTWNVAKLIHAKAASFESGYSLTVAELMLHAYNKQKGMMKKDCEILRDLVDKIRAFIINERDNPSDEGIGISTETEFVSIEDLQKDEESLTEPVSDFPLPSV